MPWIIGSLQATEALKILVGSDRVGRDLLVLDAWDRSVDLLPLSEWAAADCPACAGTYDFLDGRIGPRITSLCGQNAVQIWNLGSGLPVAEIRRRLSALGKVEGTELMTRFPIGAQELVIFYDGRVIVRGTRDVEQAKALYAKYVGA